MSLRALPLLALFVAGSGSALALASGCSSGTTRVVYVDPEGGAPDGGDVGEEGGASSGNPPAMPEKPGCAQTAYTETLPTTASISDLPFSTAQANAYVLNALARRYPLGKAIAEGGVSSPLAAQQGNCIDRFLQDKSSPAGAQRSATTVVHECGHIFDLGSAQGSTSTYVLRPDLKFSCDAGDTTSRGGKTFARSRIKTDAFYAKRKACGGQGAQGCDFYADVYLNGNPDDATFDSGDQGYNSVLEEATQYINSLATALAFQEAYAGRKSSERDGILTFLWYIERYFAYARTNETTAYDALAKDKCWRQATLSVWDRAWFYLDATKGKQELGIDDTAIEALVKDPALTAEIDALRKLECQ